MKDEIKEAVSRLEAGGLVAFPTETVYGLGADAANPEAVAKIFKAKGRPADHPLIVHLPSVEHLPDWAEDIPPLAYALAKAFWPGPLTLILKSNPAVPSLVTGGQSTVGLRVPSHPVALALLQAFAGAQALAKKARVGIAAPSANRFGRISPTEAKHVREELGEAVALILDGGACAVGIESTIVDLSQDPACPRILRPGHITPAAIFERIGVMPHYHSEGAVGATPRVSGSLTAHYAPRTPMRALPSAEIAGAILKAATAKVCLGVLYYTPCPAIASAYTALGLAVTPEPYAQGFYAALRDLDHRGCDEILVELPPQGEAWVAVHDRLGRALAGAGQP